MDEIKINNTEKSAVDGKWKNPGASLYNELCDASNWKELLEEAYLIAPINDIHNDPRMKTPFNRSGCKYPHHIVKDGKLVLSKSGVRAAYARLKQMDKYSGNAKEHIEKHLKELGMMDKDGVHYEDAIQQNFFQIEMYLQEKTGYPFIEDFMPDDYLEEKSHGKLQFDFRMGWDYNTGHMIKVVYSLDNIQIDDVGDFYYSTHNVSHDEYLDYTRKNITKKGSTDHKSHGQKVLAIVDLVTKKRLRQVKLLNPYCQGIDTHATIQSPENLKEAQAYADKNPDKVFTIVAGQIDNNASFKSTHWASNVIDPETGENFRFRKIAQSEMLKDGRGWKVNNLSAKGLHVYNDERRYLIKHNPSKKDALREIDMHAQSVDNFVADVNKHISEYTSDKLKQMAGYVQMDRHNISYARQLINQGADPIKTMKKLRQLLDVKLPVGSESFDIMNESVDQYDPPYNADEVIEKYGMDAYNRLAQDPAHKFRMDTGIELIHEEPSIEELNRIHNNWQLMSDQQKEISDNKSIELFGMNNEDHYIQLLSRYDNSREYSVKKTNNEYQLISNNGEWISRMKYYIYDDIPNFDWINIADVDTNEKYLHQGYATILLNELINDMHIQHPTMGLYLLVRVENLPAIKLYEKCGFKILKTQASDNGEFYIMYLGDADINQLKNTNFMVESPDYKESIQESMEWINQFVNNEEFRENAATLANIQSPQSLSKWMSNIKPAYAAKRDNFYHDVDDKNFNPNDQSSLQPPKDIARSKKGSVYDKVELERYWFDNHGYEYAVLCLIMEKDVNDFIIHPFIVYQQGKSIYWFENSLPNVDGSIQFKRLDDLIKCVIGYVRKANDTSTKRVAVYYLSDPPKYGINKREYMRYVQTQIELPLDDLPTKLFSESVEYFEEKSHGNLKYCYRVGFDAATGEQVAIEFILDSNAITAVSDPRLIDKAKETIAKSGKDIPDKTYDDMNAKASGELKSKIKKLGHVDFVTSELEVHSIFTKSGKKLNSVNLIPLFSDIVNKSINSLYQSGVIKHGVDSISKVIASKEFVKLLLNKVNYLKYQPEKYEVGKKSGNDKYKSTKLLWDVDMMLSYRYTPILRGLNAKGRGVDNADDAMNFIMNDMNNKFKKHKSFEEETIRYTPLDDLILEYSSWGEGYYEANFIGGEKSYQPRDQLTFGNLSIEDIYMGIMYNNPISEECVTLDGSSDEYINGLREEANMLSEFKDYDSFDEGFMFEAEDNVDEENTQEESMPKQTDKKESDKNGVNRKKLYIAFIEWSKTFSDKNAFGSMFDKDAFHVTYPFVPEAMRYFYRIANPLMCILSGNLTFFQLSELRKINAKNSQLANMMIFAATENDMRVFNVKDGAVYMATEENGAIKLGAKLADTFDLYIQTMINRGDILNGADPDKVPDAPPDLSDEEDTSEDSTTEEDIMDEPIEDTHEDNPKSSEEPPALEDNEESK